MIVSEYHPMKLYSFQEETFSPRIKDIKMQVLFIPNCLEPLKILYNSLSNVKTFCVKTF